MCVSSANIRQFIHNRHTRALLVTCWPEPLLLWRLTCVRLPRRAACRPTVWRSLCESPSLVSGLESADRSAGRPTSPSAACRSSSPAAQRRPTGEVSLWGKTPEQHHNTKKEDTDYGRRLFSPSTSPKRRTNLSSNNTYTRETLLWWNLIQLCFLYFIAFIIGKKSIYVLFILRDSCGIQKML